MRGYPVPVRDQQPTRILGMKPGTLAVVGIGGLGAAWVASEIFSDEDDS